VRQLAAALSVIEYQNVCGILKLPIQAPAAKSGSNLRHSK
jgi:hypothetical protein